MRWADWLETSFVEKGQVLLEQVKHESSVYSRSKERWLHIGLYILSLAEGQVDGQGAGGHDVKGESEKNRFIQPWEEKAKEGPYCCLN